MLLKNFKVYYNNIKEKDIINNNHKIYVYKNINILNI